MVVHPDGYLMPLMGLRVSVDLARICTNSKYNLRIRNITYEFVGSKHFVPVLAISTAQILLTICSPSQDGWVSQASRCRRIGFIMPVGCQGLSNGCKNVIVLAEVIPTTIEFVKR